MVFRSSLKCIFKGRVDGRYLLFTSIFYLFGINENILAEVCVVPSSSFLEYLPSYRSTMFSRIF